MPRTRKPKKLPTFKGYTVDCRLRLFRKAVPDKILEYISFDSPKGQKLLAKLQQRKEVKGELRHSIQ